MRHAHFRGFVCIINVLAGHCLWHPELPANKVIVVGAHPRQARFRKTHQDHADPDRGCMSKQRGGAYQLYAG